MKKSNSTRSLLTFQSAVFITVYIVHCSLFIISAQTNQPDRQAYLDSLYTFWQDESQADSMRTEAFSKYIWKGFLSSQPDSAFVLAEEMINFGKKQNYPKGEAIGLSIQGTSFKKKREYPKALEYYKKSLKIHEQIGNQRGIAYILNYLGSINKLQGDYPKALEYYTKSLKINEKIDNQNGIATDLVFIGILYFYQGDYPKSLEYYKKCLEIRKQLGDQEAVARVMFNIGDIYSIQGDYLKGLDYCTKSLKIYEQFDNQIGIAACMGSIGLIYRKQGDYSKALDYLTKKLKIDEQSGKKNSIAQSLNNIGNIYFNQGDYPQALDYYKKCLAIHEQIGYQQGIASSNINIGNIYNDQGDKAKALEYYTHGLKIYEQCADKYGIALAFNHLGNLYENHGDYPKALDYCQKGYDLAKTIGSLVDQKEGCECLYLANKYMGNGNKALKYHELMLALDDSLQSEETAKKLMQMEFQKVMLRDSIAKAEEARLIEEVHKEELRKEEKTRNILFISGLFLFLISGGLLIRVRYIRKSNAALQIAKDRSESLLLNILPEEIAEELKAKGRANARDFEVVSILFTDFKEFTQTSEKLSAQELVSEINTCFEAFDTICSKYGIEKIKTIGDAYMAAGGLPVPNDDSVKNTVLAALEMQVFIFERKQEQDTLGKTAFEMRVGINTGPVVAGIVGVKKFQYDVWGDTVNTASRIESNGEVGQVNISQYTYELLKDDPQFKFEYRGKVEAKGKGKIDMYFVNRSRGAGGSDE